MGQKVKSWEWYYKNYDSWYEELRLFVSDGNCIDPVSSTPVTLVSDLIPPEKFYICLGQLMAINTLISSKLTFDDEGLIKTSFIAYDFIKPEAENMVKVMDET